MLLPPHPTQPDRHGRVVHLSCLIALLIAIVLSIPPTAASGVQGSDPGPVLRSGDDLTSSAQVARSIEAMENGTSPPGKSGGEQKFTSDLLDSPLMQHQDSGGGETHSGSVLVYITLTPDTPTSSVDPLVDAVIDRDEDHHLAVARVTVLELDALAADPRVKAVSRVSAPRVNAGRTVTAGDTFIHADQLRTQFGAAGAGVKIGVISDGLIGLTEAQATGDLPADIHLLSASDGGNEGTAMLEIIHDVAPEATLYFHEHGSNVLAFNDAVDALVAEGCTVICDDICWPKEPFFEQGIVASHIASVIRDKPVIYVSAASNYADQHYYGMYHNDGDNFHDFSGGTSVHHNMYVDIPAGSDVSAVLQWDDPFGGSGNDYDLYLVDARTGAVLDQSTARQDGDDDPLETIEYRNDGFETVEGEFVVRNYRGEALPRTLDFFVYPGEGATMYSNNVVPENSIYGHQAVPGVVTVGAVRADGVRSVSIEPFSSRGPVNLVYPSPVSIIKPDICAPDRSAVSGAGGFEKIFVGTSASAPHVAGVIAQIWGMFPTMSAARVRTALLSSAEDLGSPGRDSVYGNGLVNAVQMYTAAGGAEPPRLTSGQVTITPTPGPTVQASASTAAFPTDLFRKSTPFDQPGELSPGMITSEGAVTPSPIPSAAATTAPAFVRWYPW